MKTYYVTQDGITISGMDRNKGTWDAGFNTKRTALFHGRKLKSKHADSKIAVETMTQGEVWEIK